MLFSRELEDRQVLTFGAEGFANPVAGVVYRGTNPPVCGAPLGGVATGCIDIEANGLWGFSTIFNCLCPRRGPLGTPLLGMTVDSEEGSRESQAWMLTTLNMSWRDDYTCVNKLARYGPAHAGAFRGARVASEIHYWGHFPVVDMEYVTDAPIEVALRAWAPFVPGDVEASNIPGAVFEVHLHNASDQPKQGTLAFTFPGPSEAEAGTTTFRRRQISDGSLSGVLVSSPQAEYVLGVLAQPELRLGGDLGADSGAWTTLAAELPHAVTQAGASLAVRYALDAGEHKVIRFVLSVSL